MNNLSTSKPSKLQNIWSSMPWGRFMFLLAVFVFSSPLYRNISFSGIAIDDAAAVVNVMHRDNWTRIAALLLLGAFALFNFLSYKPGRFQNGRCHHSGPLAFLLQVAPLDPAPPADLPRPPYSPATRPRLLSRKHRLAVFWPGKDPLLRFGGPCNRTLAFPSLS